MTHPEDHEIVEWFTQHASLKEKAFTALTLKYGERLYFHIYHYLKNHEDTNDVLQNVLVKAYRNLDGFNQESGLYTWLYRIATNEALNYIQANKRHTSSSIDNGMIQITDSSVGLPDAEVIEKHLNDAIRSLPEKQAIVFHLRYFDELPFAEIARITGTSEGGLKASYHIARQKVEDFIRRRLNLLD